MTTVGLRRLTEALKVITYLTLGIGALFFIYRLVTFAIVLRHADDLGKYTSTSIYQLPEEHYTQKEWSSENGKVRLTLCHVYGELQHKNLTRRVIIFLLGGELVLFFCFFVAIINLANLFEDLGEGKVFEANNAHRLRLIGLVVVGATIFTPIWEVLPLWLFPADVIVPGTQIPWLFVLWVKTNLGLLLGGLLLLVVAEAFRIGHRLDEEQRLTV